MSGFRSALAMLLLVACSATSVTTTTESGEEAGVSQAELEAEIAELRTQLDDALEAVDRISAERDDLRDRVAETELEVEAAEEAGEGQVAAIQAELDALRVAFDPALQAARAQFADGVLGFVCEMARANPESALSVGDVVQQFVATSPEFAAAFGGLDPARFVDMPALTAEIERCKAEALLVAPKSDGFWTVGVEIAPGTWTSSGVGDGCYWARLTQNQDIIDNHFGAAGGSITIRASDYEVEFDDCGTWTYLG